VCAFRWFVLYDWRPSNGVSEKKVSILQQKCQLPNYNIYISRFIISDYILPNNNVFVALSVHFTDPYRRYSVVDWGNKFF